MHRRDELRASKIMIARAGADPKISFAWNSRVVSPTATRRLTSITLADTTTGEERDLEVQGCFIAIGHDPRSARCGADRPRRRRLRAGAARYHPHQPARRAFAAGDLVDHTYRQAITAAGTGCSAALDAERYLADTQRLADLNEPFEPGASV